MATLYGLPTCGDVARWLPIFLRLLALYGITVRVTQLTGFYGPSGGTHGGGGAIDVILVDPGPRSRTAAYRLIIKLARLAGADPSWHRPEDWDNAGGIEHAHITLRGCKHRSPQCVGQEGAVDRGENGLMNRAPDPGYRPLSRRSWSQGLAWALARLTPAKKGIDMASLRILTRTKDIKIGRDRPVRVPLEDKYPTTKPSSALVPTKADVHFIVTADVVAAIPKGGRALARWVHCAKTGRVVGSCGWQDISHEDGNFSYQVVTGQGVIEKGRKLRLDIKSPTSDVTIASIKTRVHYWR